MTLHIRWALKIPKRGLTDAALGAQMLDTALFEATRTLALLADAEVTQRTPVDRGQLRGAWQPIAVKRHTSFHAMVVNPVAYAIPVNDGQVPHWPPLGPLRAWAQRVLGNASLGYVVARKIAKHGTKPVHMVEDALEAVKRRAPTIVRAALRQLRDKL